DDLPRHAEPVLEPAAALDLAAGGQSVPQRVHLGLGLAVHEQREALREAEHRPAVITVEKLLLDLERARVHAAVWPTSLTHDARVLEQRDIEVHRFIGFVIEHQERNDFLHVALWVACSPDEAKRNPGSTETQIPHSASLHAGYDCALSFPRNERLIETVERADPALGMALALVAADERLLQEAHARLVALLGEADGHEVFFLGPRARIPRKGEDQALRPHHLA